MFIFINKWNWIEDVRLIHAVNLDAVWFFNYQRSITGVSAYWNYPIRDFSRGVCSG